MKIQTYFLLLILCVSVVFAAGSVRAAVTVTQFVGVDNDLDITSTTFTRAFDVQNANSILVAFIYLDQDTRSFSASTYGGVAPFLSVADGRGFIFVWKNPTTDASQFSFTSNGSTGGIIFWELGGVDLSAPITESSTNTITTPVDNAFVLSMAWLNGGTSAITPPTGFTASYNGDVRTGNTMAGAYATIATAGNVNVTWGTGSNGSPYSLAFASVPEPSSLYFIFASLTLLLRRRR